MNSKDLRQNFLDFFKSKGHEIRAGSSLIPEDPTLLFTVAGMVPFKNYFLRKVPITFKRAASCQKCIRTNDIENVGKTRRHHTFFEMLGNFSFGDYFKKEAIEWAWEFLTEIIKLPKNRMYISVYKDDDEAYEIWNKKMKIPAERIFRMGKETNFWEMGTVGPCGYCSEIYFDLEGSSIATQEDIEKNDDRFLEIWNLVFTQFEKKADGSLVELEYKNIDTGMGLERLAAVSQGVYSNFETDLFMPIINFIAKKAGIQYKSDAKKDISLRVIADHLRSAVFLIADGVLPSNEGRGYVLRRIIRRGVRHCKLLGFKEIFLFEGVSPVISIMQDFYPELLKRKEYIMQIIKLEEEKFQTTMEKGIEILENEMERLKKLNEKILSGNVIFKLYDTYGFPVEITEEIIEEHGIKTDKNRFDELMDMQRETARKSWKGTSAELLEKVPMDLIQKLNVTLFTGYENLKEENCKILAIIKDKKEVNSAEKGDEINIILDKTPFYAESGGQIGDAGVLLTNNCEILVFDTKKIDERYFHICKVKNGNIKKGDIVIASVDEIKRKDTMKNHSATHLLQAALRKILGVHVEQSGSYVGYDRLRFDFTHFAQITTEEILKIEDLVNKWIQECYAADIKEMDIDSAKKQGAIALFEDKYKKNVRTVKIGDVSFELCGGTHVKNTGEIGLFKIIYEGSISAGIRRIEALTGNGAIKLLNEYEKLVLKLKNNFKAGDITEIEDKIDKLIEENKNLKKQMENTKKDELLKNIEEYINNKIVINEINTIIVKLNGISKDAVRVLGDNIKLKIKKAFILITNVLEDKVNFLAIVTDDLVDKLDASKIVKEVAKVCGGGGGGRKNMAEAGGKDVNKLDQAISLAKELLKRV